jgi:hypothetical protein
MVDYITTASLRAQVGPVNEQATVLRKAEQRSPSGSTFLSHSTKDADLLPAVIRLLERHGAEVYVDKKDETLPPYTSRETAQMLRERIQQSRKFILFTTKNSKDSRWVPWELGIADGYRQPPNVAILPSVDATGEKAWTEQEYLGVYNRIVHGRIEGRPETCYMVYNQKRNSATELGLWLRG